MRVSELLMNNSFLNGIASNKSKMDTLSKQIANQSSILKPSDSPIGTAKILRLNSKISSTDLYLKNIQNSFGFVNETIRGLESMESEISGLLAKLVEVNNATNEENFNTYADQIDHALDSILTAANTNYDGKYLFGGTSSSSKPYSLTSDRSAVYVNADDVSGKSLVKIANGTNQKINIPGSELFGTIVKQSGKLDSSAAVGSVVNDSISIYSDYGTQFDLNVAYEKISVSEYRLTYDIQDGVGSSIKSGTVNLEFDPLTGKIIKVDGKNKSDISISDSTQKINFNLDFNSLEIASSSSPLTLSANQERDIFNTIIKIRDDLRNSLKPNESDVNAVKNFHNRMLNKMSDAGFIYNTLENTQSLLETQRVEIEGMISAEKDLDMAKAIIDLQNYDYILQVSYKMSAMILPKSLLDYL